MNDEKPRTVMIVADDGAVRVLLHQWLRIGLPDCQIVQAKSGIHALGLLPTDTPSVVLVDMDARWRDAVETTQQIKAAHPLVKVIILSRHEEPEYMSAAARARASGYIAKRAMRDQLIPLVRKLLDECRHRRLWAFTRSAPAWLPGEIQPVLDLVDSEQ